MGHTTRAAVDLLGSRQLALLLFLATAILALYGSLMSPQEAEIIFFKGYGERSLPAARFLGLVDTFRSPVFLALLGSLALNLVVCTFLRQVRGRRAGGTQPGRRSGLTALLDLLLHLSVLILMAGGAAKGIWGVTLTKNLHVGLSTDTALDWGLDAEVPLGFTVLVRERVDDHYPPLARVGVKRADTGAKVALVEVGTGSPAALPGVGATLTMDGFDREGARFLFTVVAGGQDTSLVLEGKAGGQSVAAAGTHTFTLVSFRDDLRSVRSLIQVLDGDQVVAEGWLGPNERLRHRGMSIFQTAWGADEFGSRYVGLQFVRDPGAPVFWAGCILLCALLPAYQFLRRRGAPYPAAGPDRPAPGAT